MGQRFNRPGSNLATVARETGFPVREIPGWTNHDHGAFSSGARGVSAVVCHHTAGPEPERTRSNYPSLNVVRNGRAGLPGPLSNFGLGFDGTIYIISAGVCWHAGRGSWNGAYGNSQAIGIEAEDGGDGDWTAAQLDAYPRLCAAICRFLGVNAGAVCGHKEWCSPPGRKIDPAGIDMHQFRTQVGHYLHNPHQIRRGGGNPPTAPVTTQPGGIEEMALDTAYKDWAGNDQSVQSWMNHVDRRLFELHQAILGLQQSRIPNDKNQTNVVNAVMDSTAWQAQDLGLTAGYKATADKLAELLANQQGLDVSAVKNAVSEALAEGTVNVDVSVTSTPAEE